MTTNRIPPDEIDAILEEAKAERVRLEEENWRTVTGQVVEDLSGARAGWTIAEGPVVRNEGGVKLRRFWPARCALCGEWYLRAPRVIRVVRDSRGSRSCLAREQIRTNF